MSPRIKMEVIQVEGESRKLGDVIYEDALTDDQREAWRDFGVVPAGYVAVIPAPISVQVRPVAEYGDLLREKP